MTDPITRQKQKNKKNISGCTPGPGPSGSPPRHPWRRGLFPCYIIYIILHFYRAFIKIAAFAPLFELTAVAL